MIRKLGAATSVVDIVRADVAVIGGGTVGLVLADRLARVGKRVIVLESGGERQIGETHERNQVVYRGTPYLGAEAGRFRCLGGTSTRWGGALIPMLPADLRDGRWPVAFKTLMRHLPEVESLFDLPAGSYELPDLIARHDGRTAAYVARLAKWPAFARRNVAALLNRPLRAHDGPEVWLDAHVTDFALDPGGRLATVTAKAADGARLTVAAPQFVVAAGAIESTRLLLLLDRQYDDRLFAPDNVLGRYLSDHLSAVVGTIDTANRTAMNRMFGFRFERHGMRNLRFEPSEIDEVRTRIPAGFAHISFTSPEGGGFDALRQVYRDLQQRRPPDATTLTRLARAAPWLGRAGWWRFVEKRVLYPAGSQLQLHMVVDQAARDNNRITLDNGRVDAFGQPLAVIDWRITPEDVAAVQRSTNLFEDDWRASRLAELGTIRRTAANEVAERISSTGGIYHPTGTIRLGANHADGVLDAAFRCFRLPNVSVLSTAAFPSGGGANPTMMLLLVAMSLAERFEKEGR